MKPESPPEVMTGPAALAEQRYVLRLLADPALFATVRQLITSHLGLWGHPTLADTAAMCVTEILANVHRHVESPECELVLESTPNTVLAAVSDYSPALPVLRAAPDSLSESGRGLFLISTLADAWGATPTDTGKRVWVLLREPPFPFRPFSPCL
ncbi:MULTISPECIES: ATP-binding protein [Streptomycetaceae]|uniref:Regulatory protein n=1 Tax=Streptantibioticus cattleyicolor (strain ATCC 35852 / DSM 46488 / JCM 4925 / NBRC 14057 / NRRL 8057) TaxID=1003195 RepID=F8K0B9_STREN|nr:MULTISPECIES: ATP-binding protein [Streptomycetaceae]AEW96100.1 regulatory protein [Streptantibioticus cattleyicolor NRRL 8057 = DSM 46488]MYS60631.1 ATP-binding protein [Streptomyces sp. SID5468]CCB76439.1 protein of unknown function [Streptantibioticus cattleyicolor NRRL 8057 = DSM 46488]